MGKRSVASKRNTSQKMRDEVLADFSRFEEKLSRDWMNVVRPVAIAEALSLCVNISLVVLHDYYGFGKKRMTECAEHILDYYDSLEGQYVYLDEIAEEVGKMTGHWYGLDEREVDTLEKFGLDKLMKNAVLEADQLKYMKLKNGTDRRKKEK